MFLVFYIQGIASIHLHFLKKKRKIYSFLGIYLLFCYYDGTGLLMIFKHVKFYCDDDDDDDDDDGGGGGGNK